MKTFLSDAALLAGLPQRPTSLDPYRHPERARKRRTCAGQMLRLKMITQVEHDQANNTPIHVDWREGDSFLDNNNHYSAHVRKLLEEKLSDASKVKDGGYRVYTSGDPALQTMASSAVRKGLRELDKRQGWRGPLFHLEANQLKFQKASTHDFQPLLLVTETHEYFE